MDKPKSNAEWIRWGREDPFWAVSSWVGRDRSGANPWTPDEFYRLGQSDWADFRRRLEHYGSSFGSAVEIGCGAGRLTKHMAQDFTRVVAIDVSEGMLDAAREHLREPNIEFRLGDGMTLPVDDRSVDVVFSTHVFQHFDSLEVARANFREIVRVLKPGGAMLIHLPTVNPPARLAAASAFALNALKKVGDLRAHYRRRRGLPLMRGLEYPWSWLRTQLSALGVIDIEITLFPVRSNGEVHHCVLGRKAEGG